MWAAVVLAQLYAAHDGLALAPSGPRLEPVAAPVAGRASGIDDPVNLLDAQARAPRWTQTSGLPPLSPGASISWEPAAAAPLPVAHEDSGRPDTAGASTANRQQRSPSEASTARQTSRVHLLIGAYAPLMGLLWFWLTLRALVVDRRGAWVRLIVVCVLGSPCATALLALAAAGFFTSMRDKFHPGIAAFIGCLAGAALGFLAVEGVANPTFKDRRGRRHSRLSLREPSLPLRWHTPGRMLCRWGLAGVALGCGVLSVAFGYMRDPLAALETGGLQPTHVATGLAVAAALAGLGKVAAIELRRTR
ncbi:hypothetical protein [Stigmatella erecta]|uniref:Uncharacterized protein n=1 Tax=Stigmatella erecta TaxID=83460 RepID=A0A1I0IME3_9BACT|nr:hypothetical protein [Stigmatella erecta]SET98179.1 hypothetical protein SAMN05443639_106154 [Stigmatella erecta]